MRSSRIWPLILGIACALAAVLVFTWFASEVTEGEVLTCAEPGPAPMAADSAAATALALWYEESKGMLLSASEG